MKGKQKFVHATNKWENQQKDVLNILPSHIASISVINFVCSNIYEATFTRNDTRFIMHACNARKSYQMIQNRNHTKINSCVLTFGISLDFIIPEGPEASIELTSNLQKHTRTQKFAQSLSVDAPSDQKLHVQ